MKPLLAATSMLALFAVSWVATTGGALAQPRLGVEEPATPTVQSARPAANSPVLAVDPHDDQMVAMATRVDAPDYGCTFELSGDGGRRWLPISVFDTLPAGAEKCFAPDVGFDGSGRLYYLFVGLTGTGNRPMGVYLTFSDDRGRTFSAPRQVLGALNFGVRMAIDPTKGRHGRVHLAWIKAVADVGLGGFGTPPNPIMAAFSDDGGQTLSEPVQVSDGDRSLVLAPALTIGPDHAVHVAYYDLGRDKIDYYGLEGPVWDGSWSVVVATSTDSGRGYGRGRVVDAGVRTNERVMVALIMPPPSVAAGPGGLTCVAWTDARYGDADAVARCSRNGRRWEPLLRLNDDRRDNGLSQYLPRLAIAPGGRIDAVYLDRRDDFSNTRNHTRYTYSTDDGRTWAPSRRLSTHSSYIRHGQRYALVTARGRFDLGARLGLLSLRHAAVAAWPDTRYSMPSSAQQQVMTRTVEFPEPGSRRPWGFVAATALVPAMVVLGRRRCRHRTSLKSAGTDHLAPLPGASPPRDSPRRSTRWWFPIAAVVVVVGAVVLPGVVAGPSRHRTVDRPPPPQRVALSMTEYHYGYTAPKQAGRVVFDVVNAGKERHNLVVFALADDFPPIDEQLRGTDRRSTQPIAALPTLRPGERANYAFDVAPNQRYAFVCFVATADEVIHGTRGMNTEFAVQSSDKRKQGS